MSDVALVNLTLCSLHAEAFEEIFEDLLQDIERHGIDGYYAFGADPHDVRMSLNPNLRRPRRGERYVTLPYLWQTFLDRASPSDRISIFIPPAGILEFFAQVHLQVQGLPYRFRRMREVLEKARNKDINALREQVDEVEPMLISILQGNQDVGAMTHGGLLSLQEVWRESKIVSLRKLLPSVDKVSSLPAPPQVDLTEGLRYLGTSRSKFRANAAFFDQSDMLNFDAVSRAAPLFRECRTDAAMTSMGSHTRKAYRKSWSGDDISCPSRHAAGPIVLLMMKREMETRGNATDYLRAGIFLLRDIRRQLWEITDVRSALQAMANVPDDKMIPVSQRLEAAIGHWVMNYFFPLFQVQPPESSEDGKAVLDSLAPLVLDTGMEQVEQRIEEVAEQTSRHARRIFREDFAEALEDPTLLPLKNPLAMEVLNWLTRD